MEGVRGGGTEVGKGGVGTKDGGGIPYSVELI